MSKKENIKEQAEQQGNPAALAEDVSQTSGSSSSPDGQQPAKPNRAKRFIKSYWDRKKWTLPLTALLLAGVLLAVPATRFPLLGLFMQKTVSVTVIDSKTGKPVTSAQVEIGGSIKTTDNKGQVKLRASVGRHEMLVTKKYYKSATSAVLVDVTNQKSPYAVRLQATGRRVPVTVLNKITDQPLANVTLKAAGTEAKTDKSGKAVLVLPADKSEETAAITLTGFNDNKASIRVTEQTIKENTFYLTQAGKIYFLSRQSGNIDVVATDLDGGERKVILAGTGKEDQYDTVLLAARDWKYLALKSKRDGGQNSKMFLIDTSNHKTTVMDEGDAYFTPVGWSGHHFVYQVNRNNRPVWEGKSQALKSFNAESGKLSVIDETDGEGNSTSDYAFNQFSSVYLVDDEVVFSKYWQAYYDTYKFYYSPNPNRLSGKHVNLVSAKADGSNKKSIRDFPIPANSNYYTIQLKPYGPNEVYIQANGQEDGKSEYYEYEDGKLESKPDVTSEQFNKPYPTYLESPTGKSVFWSDPRDGKNTLFLGDENAGNEKQIAALSEYAAYGWYSDNYLLVSKQGSELYVMPLSGSRAVKITDYHKPATQFNGYGKGYGGL